MQIREKNTSFYDFPTFSTHNKIFLKKKTNKEIKFTFED